MVARINTIAFHGLDVQNVDVQVQISNGLPAFTIVGPINPDMPKRAFFLCFLVFMLLFSPIRAIAGETAKHVDYGWISKRAHVLTAMPVNNGITVFGSRLFLRFDDKFSEAHFSGPLKFEGYAQFIKPLSSQSIVVAGLDHKAGSLSSLLAKDERRNFILKMNPETLEVQKFLPLKDRVSYGLAVDTSGHIVLLSGAEHGSYTLTVFDSNLKEIRLTTFGIGGKGDVAFTSEGNYIAIGFDRTKDGRSGLPTYWAFSPELKLIEKRVLSERTKSNGNTDGLMKILSHEQETYLIYGWDDCPGCKKPDSSVLWVEKIKDDGAAWKKEYSYGRHSRVFIFSDGNPFLLEPKKDAIYQTIFNKEDGSASMVMLNRPNSPVECFPPNLYYEIVDAFQLLSGDTNVVLTSRPLDNPDAGCVTIGKVKL